MFTLVNNVIEKSRHKEVYSQLFGHQTILIIINYETNVNLKNYRHVREEVVVHHRGQLETYSSRAASVDGVTTHTRVEGSDLLSAQGKAFLQLDNIAGTLAAYKKRTVDLTAGNCTRLAITFHLL